MATINWPSTLPGPNASNFSFSHKKMGNVLTFSSGRPRVTQTRLISNSRFLVNAELSFVFTLGEYATFAAFYDTEWKKLSPQKDNLAIPVANLTWLCWPSANVNCSRNENTWTVSFSVEAFLPIDNFSFSNDETDPRSPLWPQEEFYLLEGATLSRISRDVSSSDEMQLLSRTVSPDDSFVLGKVSLNKASAENILRFVSWWLKYCKAGALPFKLPASSVDLGFINGRLGSYSGFYAGKIMTPPQVSFDGYFGSISLTFVLTTYNAGYSKVSRLVSNTGAIFTTNAGKHIIGVY